MVSCRISERWLVSLRAIAPHADTPSSGLVPTGEPPPAQPATSHIVGTQSVTCIIAVFS